MNKLSKEHEETAYFLIGITLFTVVCLVVGVVL